MNNKQTKGEPKIPETRIITVPPNGQICLGRKYAGHTFQVQFISEGEILLKRGKFIPDDHDAFYTPEAIEQLKEFDKWQQENPVPEEDDSEAVITGLIKNKE